MVNITVLDARLDNMRMVSMRVVSMTALITIFVNISVVNTNVINTRVVYARVVYTKVVLTKVISRYACVCSSINTFYLFLWRYMNANIFADAVPPTQLLLDYVPRIIIAASSENHILWTQTRQSAPI